MVPYLEALVRLQFFIFILTACTVSMPASAYIGPGAGLTMLGSLVALLGSVIIALAMVLFWPARLLYKRMKARKTAAGETTRPPSEKS